MTYEELVKLVLCKAVDLNSENIKITLSKDQLTCWFLDSPYILSNILIDIENKGDAYEIICWNKDNDREVITADEMLEMMFERA